MHFYSLSAWSDFADGGGVFVSSAREVTFKTIYRTKGIIKALLIAG
jgi:hypothetical protein